MKARQLIEGASFGPEALNVIGKAFDLAWADVEHAFPTPLAKDDARLTIANGILANASDDSRDVEELRMHGHRALIRAYPQAMVEALSKPKRSIAN
jgi:hypothetical protein